MLPTDCLRCCALPNALLVLLVLTLLWVWLLCADSKDAVEVTEAERTAAGGAAPKMSKLGSGLVTSFLEAPLCFSLLAATETVTGLASTGTTFLVPEEEPTEAGVVTVELLLGQSPPPPNRSPSGAKSWCGTGVLLPMVLGVEAAVVGAAVGKRLSRLRSGLGFTSTLTSVFFTGVTFTFMKPPERPGKGASATVPRSSLPNRSPMSLLAGCEGATLVAANALAALSSAELNCISSLRAAGAGGSTGAT